MVGLLREIQELGFPVSVFIRRSGITLNTLRRIDAGDERVRLSTMARAQRCLSELRTINPLQEKRRIFGSNSKAI